MQPLDAERVREWRHRRMLSQQEVADRAGTSLFTIQRIERGEGNVRPKTGRGVADALGIPIEELLPKAQAPLFRELPDPAVEGGRRASDKRAAAQEVIEELRRTVERQEAGAALDKFREQMEKKLAGGELDKTAIEETGATAAAFWPALLLALDAEMRELKAMHRGEPEAAAESALLYPAVERFVALSEKVNRKYRELAETAAQRQEAERRKEEIRQWTQEIEKIA